MKKTVLLLITTFIIFSFSGLASGDYKPLFDDYADKLSEINVFRGTEKGFELERIPTRIEGLVMLIRLLGYEDEALEDKFPQSPFTDVADWAQPYVNLAYEKNLTYGISQTLFGSDEPLDLKTYMTYLLRSLGYDDLKGEFSWETSNRFALIVGLVKVDFLMMMDSMEFRRDQMAYLSYLTLGFNMKDEDIKLVKKLVETGYIDENIALAIGLDTKKEVVLETEIEEKKIKLMGQPSATKSQLAKWAISKGMIEEGLELIDIYFELSIQKGLDPIVQYAQMCYETGFLYKIESSAGLNASFHNPCGLKITEGGGNYDPNAHMRFDTWYDGIDAHTDHSALYAGANGYPRSDTLDPRHFNWLFGVATYINDLSGRWAPSPTYHEAIERFVLEIQNTR